MLWSNSDVPKVGRAALTGPVDQLTIFLDGQEIVNNPGSAAVVSATRYYTGSGLLATRSTVSGLTFVGTDSQGTLAATLTTAGVATRQRYKPFGEQRGAMNALPSERGFIGQVEDTATGLSYLNARHYDARNAIFISVDPVLSIYDPMSLNAYIYGGNSPIVFSDPTGLEKGANGEARSLCNKKNGTNACAGMFANPNHAAKAESAWMSNWNSGFVAAVNADYAESLKQVDGTSVVELIIQNLVFDYTACKGVSWGCGVEVATSNPAGKIYKGVKVAAKAIGAVDDVADTLKTAKRATKTIPCASFRADTLVLMADGSKKPIGEIEVGDKVVATDPVTGESSVRTVTRLFTHIDDDLLDLVVLTDGGVETIHTTDHHRFWNDTTKAWAEAKDLKSGDRLLTADGDVVTVGGLKRVPGSAPMLDLTVEYDHTFYVALNDTAVLVHNQTCPLMKIADVGKKVSPQKQARHLAGTHNGGGYFNSLDDAQSVLDAFHSGGAEILGVTKTGHIAIRVPGVTGFNNNAAAGFVDQATNIFLVKGTRSVSIVPTSPVWSP